jgi:hypothetical protein
MGLGGLNSVPLARARELAAQSRALLSEKEPPRKRFPRGKFEQQLAERLGLGSDWVDDLGRLPSSELKQALRQLANGVLDGPRLEEIRLKVVRAGQNGTAAPTVLRVGERS